MHNIGFRSATLFIPVLLLLVGCKPDPKGAPVVDKAQDGETAPKARSKFFTQVAGQRADLTERLRRKFPAVEFAGGQAGPAGGGGWAQVEVWVVVDKSPPKFTDDMVPLLAEVEQYCTALAESTGAEFQGQVEEQFTDGKKDGFKFDYKAQADSGLVRAKVLGRRVLLTVSERE